MGHEKIAEHSASALPPLGTDSEAARAFFRPSPGLSVVTDPVETFERTQDALPASSPLHLLVGDEDLVALNNLKFRYLSTNDQYKEARDEWLSALSPNIEYYNLNNQETFALSRINTDYDILVVGGNDAARIAKFMKSSAALIGSHPRLVLMSRSDPRRRAQVLNAGFDDVLDCSRMGTDEALFRIAALWRRHQQVERLRKEKESALMMLSSVKLPDKRLSDAELRILTELIESIGRVISYHRLAEIASRGYEQVTFNHLKVLISNIRRKIDPRYTISSVHSFGYMIISSEFD